jgi:hypothetical protein
MRIKNTCTDCKGSGICKHNRRKYRCKECIAAASCLDIVNS